MNLYFRGAQAEDASQTRLGSVSFTPCLPVALVYAAKPGDPFSSSKQLSRTHFVPTSTVFAAKLGVEPLLDLYSDSLSISVGDVMRKLRHGTEDGITDAEVLKIFNYLHNRKLGKTKAPAEFKYKVFDEEGEERDAAEEVGFSFTETLFSLVRDDFEGDMDGGRTSLLIADRVAADSFVFADTPVVQKVASRLGFRGLAYLDVFGGAAPALEDLLGIAIDDEEWADAVGLSCIRTGDDIEDDEVYCHQTVRPLTGAQIEYDWQMPAEKVAADVRKLLGAP